MTTPQVVELTDDRTEWQRNRKIIFITVGILFFVWLGMQFGLWSILTAVLVAQGIMFMMAFRRPVWAVAGLLVGQFTASGYILYFGSTPITVRFLWTILAVILLFPLLRARGAIKLGSRARSIIIPTVIFYCLATVANSVNLDMNSVFQYLRTGATALAIVYFLPAAVKNEKDLRLLTMVLLITCTISALAAIGQHYQGLGIPVYSLGNLRGNRAAGFSEGAIYLAYQLPLVILPMIAVLLLKGVGSQAQKILPVLALAMLAALYFTFTRSGMLALVPGVLIMFFLLKGKMKKVLFGALVVMGVAFLLYTNMVGNRYAQGFTEESSAAGRLVLWHAGIMIALDHPIFGIGQGMFVQMSEAYSSAIGNVDVAGALGTLGVEQAHNDFIRVWVSFGTFALIVYIWLFINIFRNFLYGYHRASSLFVKAIAFGGCGAVMAYIVNAFSHNLMDSVPLMWILAGFSIAVAKLAEANNGKRVPERLVEAPPETLPDASSS